MTSCFVTRSISSIRATSNVAFDPFSQIVVARSLWDHADLGHRVGRVRLDFEPDAETRLGDQIAVISGRE